MNKKLLALGVVGAVGWYAWRKFSNEADALRVSDGETSDFMRVSYGVLDDVAGIMAEKPNENMGLSLNGMAFIKGWEKYRSMPYYATSKEKQRGILTIGYGYTYKDTDAAQVEKFKNGITEKQANDLFLKRVQVDELAIANNVKVKLKQYQFDALVSLRYNVGSLAGTRLLEKLNAGDFEGAANEFYGWVYQGGDVLAGLVKRRQYEVRMFSTGDYLTAN